MQHNHLSFVSRAKRLFGNTNNHDSKGVQVDYIEYGEASSINIFLSVKRKTLSSIGDFFVDNDIYLCGRSLMLVHDMLSGHDPDLRQRYAIRQKSGLPMDDAWLDHLETEYSRKKSAQLDHLVNEFENQLSQFKTSARNTRAAAEGYEMELVQKVDRDLSGAANASTLAILAQQMIERTRELSLVMKNSEKHTESLEKRLDKAKTAAQTDALTGLPNRRAFEERFANQVRAARAKGSSLCVAFCDVDDFKKVNDQHGHDAGDRVLKKVAQMLDKLGTPASFVSRHGGEEFVMLFADIGIRKAMSRIDSARQQLAAKALVNSDNGQTIGRVTFSAGIAEVMSFANPRDALHAADKALYEAKRRGKNQVLIGDCADLDLTKQSHLPVGQEDE